jgi:SAM-dependent methyltransferase
MAPATACVVACLPGAPMTDLCDLCRSPALEPVYQPPGSGRGLTVYLCDHCGLMQSLPRIDRAPRRAASVSSGADWGNVRYGKGFRTEACLSILRTRADLGQRLHVLDVGSNRGSFARALLAEAPSARLTCVEPDERVAVPCSDNERVDNVSARIEDTSFPDEAFDVIHSCHTIEHLKSPNAVLAEHWRTLKPGGLLVVDAPNIALISSDDILEEWFIDKHLFHFSAGTLARLLNAGGFEVIDGPDPSDRENLLLAARKRPVAARPIARDAREADHSLELITLYVAKRARNLAALTKVAAEIASLSHKRVVLWGAGRLFDALVLHGGFDPKSLALLIDTHLKLHVDERHGMTLSGPEELAGANPGLIVVMSRAFAGEISKIAKVQAPDAEILLYSDLLSRARRAA